MLPGLWPTFGLRILTPRLTLHLPDEEELEALAELAGRGVHTPGQRPFLTPWTDTAEERIDTVLRGHWGRLADWQTQDWALGLGVFRDGEPLGMVNLKAYDFTVRREVTTSSWLGLGHHGQGYGTEARTGLLSLAFDHLGATDATSEVFPDNSASQGVSRRLGYQHDGISRDARDDEVLVSDRLRLTAARWSDLKETCSVSVRGLDMARSMFLG